MVSSSTPTRKQTQNQLTKKEKKKHYKEIKQDNKNKYTEEFKKEKKNTHPHAATITYTKNENNIS